MNGIIITNIICLSIVFIVCVICYTNYKKENADELEFIHKRIDSIYDKISSHYRDFSIAQNDINDKLKQIMSFLFKHKDD